LTRQAPASAGPGWPLALRLALRRVRRRSRAPVGHPRPVGCAWVDTFRQRLGAGGCRAVRL